MSVPKFTDYLDFISSWMTVGPPVRRKLLVVVTGRQLFGSGWWTTTATTGNGQHYRAGPNLSVLVGYKSQRRVRILQICRNSTFERKKSDVARRWETTSCIQHAQRSRVPKLLKFENTLDTTTTFGLGDVCFIDFVFFARGGESTHFITLCQAVFCTVIDCIKSRVTQEISPCLSSFSSRDAFPSRSALKEEPATLMHA